jgi:DNA invertase Pin-like site-specific DNA recombinase
LRWASWAAVSSQPQAAADKVSIPEQLEQNRAHAAKHGGEIVAELIIPGESRSIDTWEEACQRIDAYAQLRDLLAARALDVLAFYDATRLGRTHALIATIRQLCTRAGVALYETTNPPATLDAGWRYDNELIGAIKSVGSQQEVAKLVERRRIGIIGRARRGEFPAQPNYGYRVRYTPEGKRTTVVEENEAAVVRQILGWYLEGMGARTIAALLNERGVPTQKRRNIWHKPSVMCIIKNCWVYAGYVEVNKKSKRGAQFVRAPGVFDPIINEATAEAVDTERAARVANRRMADAVKRYTGVCYCTECGHGMRYGTVYPDNHHKTPNGQPEPRLRCTRHRPSCSLRETVVEAALRAEIKNLIAGNVEPPAPEDTAVPLRNDLSDVAKQLGAIDAGVARADDAFVGGLMDAARYEAQLRRLRQQQETLQAEQDRLKRLLAREEERGTRASRLADVRDYGLAMLDSQDTQAVNLWLRRHVRIYCTSAAVASIVWI